MINQLRIYEIFPDTAEAFHQRFRDHAARIMARHGFRILSMWEDRREDSLAFAYLLAWEDEEAMRIAWDAFMADEEWARIKRETAIPGARMVGGIEDRVLRAVDYSAPLETGA